MPNYNKNCDLVRNYETYWSKSFFCSSTPCRTKMTEFLHLWTVIKKKACQIFAYKCKPIIHQLFLYLFTFESWQWWPQAHVIGWFFFFPWHTTIIVTTHMQKSTSLRRLWWWWSVVYSQYLLFWNLCCAICEFVHAVAKGCTFAVFII